ncbi:MAG TPA: 2-hydroxychromene-2-carboxylate isomerase [Herbaspirillum sp.]|uniref:2-hydroxychromene-2-carboxylate isomerase n=1 Tax=Herbaspirillum sp. TaxID=1890675 RepID=UPI002D5207CA|nr:2-hydroxychromene-2-carboxylate isomerase [Herbaspirillum sp.]HZG20635.1 2-hydroxychromene-2-carboxylate isomerase [Herbaspirillum sp.]
MSAALPTIEYWFDFGSNYSYLSTLRIEQAVRHAGVGVQWRPFLLGPVFRELGWNTSPFVLQKEKGDYTWQDMARQCRKYGLPWTRPSRFPRTAVLATRVALAWAGAAWVGGFCRLMMHLNFVEDRDIDSAETVSEVLAAMDLPVADILVRAQSGENRMRLREQTASARALGIFGAPTFFVGSEMFWGNDRLEDALAACAGQAARV